MIKQLLRWLGIALAGLATALLLALVVAYGMSERVRQRQWPVPGATVVVPTDAASIEEGRRLAIVRGCFAGCHGKEAAGVVMFDDPLIARLVAPNLTSAVRKYSGVELAAIIRAGVRPDGRSTLVMPAEVFATLTDADLGRILAFLHSLPLADGPGPGIRLGPLGRVGLAVGQFKMTAQQIAEIVPPPEAQGEAATNGRYLAQTACAQCHRTSLRDFSTPGFTGPSLNVVNGYPEEAFTALLKTGVGIGGRSLGVMGPWARANLSHLTDQEIAALYSYLRSMQSADGSIRVVRAWTRTA